MRVEVGDFRVSGLEADFFVSILATILEKIEGKVFVSEQTVVELTPHTRILIRFDDDKRGWWVELDTGELAAGNV